MKSWSEKLERACKYVTVEELNSKCGHRKKNSQKRSRQRQKKDAKRKAKYEQNRSLGPAARRAAARTVLLALGSGLVIRRLFFCLLFFFFFFLILVLFLITGQLTVASDMAGFRRAASTLLSDT